MDLESVRSGHSERSSRTTTKYLHNTNSQAPLRENVDGEYKRQKGRREQGHKINSQGDRYSGVGREEDLTDREDRSIISRNRSRGNNENLYAPTLLDSDPVVMGPVDSDPIAVQIIPQDDNWGETTTAVSGYTGVTSETGISTGPGFATEDMVRMHKDFDGVGFNWCAHNASTALAFIISFLAFVSPIVMVILPQVGLNEWKPNPCGAKCEGLFLSYSLKLIILLIGSWAVFMRQPKADMPRIYIFRAIILFLVFVITFAFWLFYGVRIIEKKEEDYYSIVLFAGSLVDGLLFIHYLAVILLEVRQLHQQYAIKVVRSPDGESRCYTVGQLSIQRLAVFVLEKYYRDFPAYNPFLEHIPKRPPKLEGTFTVYDIDGNPSNNPASRSRAVFAASARRRDSGHNDRFYQIEEYERRVKKRQARLIVAAEEGFTHIKRLQEDSGNAAIPMNPMDAANAIFPSMARALQKYLRITRQQPCYTLEEILEHLAQCLATNGSPKVFLERYLRPGPLVWSTRDYRKLQTWIIICDTMLSRATSHGASLQLKQGDVTLMVNVRSLPKYNLREDVVDPKSNRFVLRLNSETSV